MTVEKAISLITYKKVRSLSYGDSIFLDKKERFEIYHYCEDEHIVFRDNDTDEELFCILYNEDNKTIELINI